MQLPREQRDQELDGLLPELGAMVWTYGPLPRWHKASAYLQVLAEFDNRQRRLRAQIDLLVAAVAVDLYHVEHGAWPTTLAAALAGLAALGFGAPPEPLHPMTERVAALLPARIGEEDGAAVGWPELLAGAPRRLLVRSPAATAKLNIALLRPDRR